MNLGDRAMPGKEMTKDEPLRNTANAIVFLCTVMNQTPRGAGYDSSMQSYIVNEELMLQTRETGSGYKVMAGILAARSLVLDCEVKGGEVTHISHYDPDYILVERSWESMILLDARVKIRALDLVQTDKAPAQVRDMRARRDRLLREDYQF